MGKFLLTVCASFGLLVSSASAQEEKEEAWRTEGVQKLEFTRLSSGKKITLDFAYALNPDCSPAEGGPVEVKTTTEPAHGAMRLSRETVFPITQRRTYASNATTKERVVSLSSTNQPEDTSGRIRSRCLSSTLPGTPERCITT